MSDCRCQEPIQTSLPNASSITRPVLTYIAVCGILLTANVAHASCSPPILLSPTGDKTSDTRPSIRWSKVPEATSYGLRLVSRVPEGAVIAQIDTQVQGEAFQPPQPLAQWRAMLQIHITPRCESSDSKPPTTSARIIIDTGLACAAPRELKVVRDDDPPRLEWSGVDKARSYEISLFGLPDGKLLGRQSTTNTSIALTVPDRSSQSVATVRARCTNGVSEASFARL